MWSAADSAAPSRLDGALRSGAGNELPLLRLLLATFTVGIGLVVSRLSTPEVDLRGPLVVLALVYASAAVAWLAQRRQGAHTGWTAGQLVADLLFIALLGVLTGGPGSEFRLLTLVPILLAATYLGARGSIVLAVIAALLAVAQQVAVRVGLLGMQTMATGSPAEAILETQLQVVLLLLVGVGGGLQAARLRRRVQLHEEALAQLERARIEVRNIVDNLGSGLLILNRQGVVARLNPAAERILGVYAEEVLGCDLSTAFGASLGSFVDLLRDVLDGGPPCERSELNIVRWDTVVVPVGISVTHLRDADGKLGGVIAIFQDLTEVRRMRERVREADRLAAVGELSASIAHEIRNPLGSIRGSVEILAGELVLDGQQRRLLDLILKESGRVNRIINDFLAFARLRPAQRLPLAVDAMLEDARLQVRQHVTFQNGQVQVEVHCPQPAPVVAADVEQLTQVFLNLAINACEAMNYSGRLVLAAEVDGAGDTCELQVHDCGPGLPEEARLEIFKPFYTTKKNGTGLGLPMVARIVHAHSGTVEADRSPLGGALFRVRLPLAQTLAEPRGPAVSAADASAVAR